MSASAGTEVSRSSGRLWWALGFGALFIWFFYPLLLLKTSFTGSDFDVQHWPWARFMAESIRRGEIPFWTPLLTAGFAFAAEGQAGVFYVPHWIAYALLPVKAAYTWLIPAHFLIAGIGIYRYARTQGVSRAAAPMAALVFCFGSAYAGCFSNTAALRVCAWVPWALICLDRLSAAGQPGRKRFEAGLALAILVALQWTAGASQMALYSAAFYAVYLLFKGRGPLLRSAAAVPAIAAGLLLAGVQVWLTVEAARASVRAGESAAFALWGSIPPTGVLSLIFPEWGGMMRMTFYSGILPLLLIAAVDWKKPPLRTHGLLALVFFLLALGRFNPLYGAFVEWSGWTWVRNPGKWLFFTSFSLSILAAGGLDRLFAKTQSAAPALRRLSVIFLAVTLFLPGIVTTTLRAAQPMIERAGERLAEAKVIEKGPRAKPAAYYQDKFRTAVREIGEAASYRRLSVRVSILWAALAALLFLFGAAFLKNPGSLILVCYLLTVADLGVYGHNWSTGFIGNAKPFPAEKLNGFPDPGPVSEGGWVEYMSDPRREMLTPNRSMLFGIAHPGGYSPLLQKRYYDLVWDLGWLDASLGYADGGGPALSRYRHLADLAGMRWIRTDRKLDGEGLVLLKQDDDDFYYRNERVQPAFAGYSTWKVLADEGARLEYLKSAAFDPTEEAVLENKMPAAESGAGVKSGRVAGQTRAWTAQGLEGALEMPAAGVAMIRVEYDPAWKVTVDGREEKTIRMNHAFLGVPVGAGAHVITARYRPLPWPGLAFLGMALTAAGALLLGALQWRGRVRKIAAVGAVILCAGTFLRADVAAAEEVEEFKTSFAFTGHLRGSENFKIHPLLRDLVRDIGTLKADFFAIGGDTICGYETAYDEPGLNREWQLVDDELAALKVPIYRVTGNHDWHSEETARVFRKRYGPEYFEATEGAVRVIGLNTTRLVPDRTLNWTEIWHGDHYLPNDNVLPEGEQLEFWERSIRAVAGDPDVKAVVVLVGGPVWLDPATSERWWKNFHPALEKLGRTVVVLCGEVQPPGQGYRRARNVHYVSHALGIMDSDAEFSLSGGSYLQVSFWGEGYRPEFRVRLLGLRAENRSRVLAALPRDTDAYLKFENRLYDGSAVTPLNRLRTVIKRFLLRQTDWYDRSFDLKAAAAVLGVLLLSFAAGWAWRGRSR